MKVISTHIFDGWIFHSQRYFKAPASALLQPLAAAPRVSAPPAAAEELRRWPPLAGHMGPGRTVGAGGKRGENDGR